MFIYRSEISEQLSEDVLTLLKDTFTTEGLQRELCTRGGKKVNEKMKNSKDSKDSSCAPTSDW